MTADEFTDRGGAGPLWPYRAVCDTLVCGFLRFAAGLVVWCGL